MTTKKYFYISYEIRYTQEVPTKWAFGEPISFENQVKWGAGNGEVCSEEHLHDTLKTLERIEDDIFTGKKYRNIQYRELKKEEYKKWNIK